MSLYLGAIHFDGDPARLRPAYERLMQRFPAGTLDLHICVSHGAGLTVFDACPDQATYEQFTTGEVFLGGVAAAGLPTPRIEGIGDVEVAHLRQRVPA